MHNTCVYMEVGVQMITYMCGIIINYFGFVNAFVGLDVVIGVSIVIAALAVIYKLGHVKQF